MLAGWWPEAATLLARSIKQRGGHPASYYNLAICFYKGGAVAKAGALFERALLAREDKGYPKARAWRDKCARELDLQEAPGHGAARRFAQAKLPV